MPFNPLPPSWIENYSSNGTNVTLPIASFPQLTSSEASATSPGDIRRFLFAFCHKIQSAWDALAVADRPTKWTLASTSTVDGPNTLTRTYIFTFKTTTTGEEVSNE